MKTFSLFRHSMMALLAIMLLIVTSCVKSSSESELLELVPANAVVAVKANLIQIAENAGCQVDNHKITLSSDLDALVANLSYDERLILDEVLTSGCTELDNIVFYHLDFNKESGAIILKINDEAALDALLSKYGIEKESQGEYNIIRTGRYEGFIQKGDIAFFVYGNREYDDITAYLDELIANASSNPITSVDWKMDVLSRGDACNVVVELPEEIMSQSEVDEITELYKNLTGKDITGIGVTYSLSFEGPTARLSASMHDQNGNLIDFTNICRDVEPDFLDYISKENLLVAATGINGNFNWMPIITSYMELFDEDDPVIASVINNYLSMADGTVALAAGPKAGMMSFMDATTDNWAVTLMAKIKEEKQDELFNTIKSLLQNEVSDSYYNRSTLTEINDKMLLFEEGKNKGYIGIVDGYLIASTDLPEANGGSIYSSSDFNGKAIARLRLDQSNFLITSFDLQCGLDFVSEVNNDENYLAITLSTEDGTPFLETLINRIYKLAPRF